MPIFRKKNSYFFKTWSPQMAYVLGFFAADGNMIKNKRGGHFISFYNNDKSIIKSIRTALNSNLKISLKKNKSVSLQSKKSYQLQVGSKEMFNDLLRLGMTPNKSLTIKMPIIPQTLFSHFLRGYFDGDGCVYFRKHWAKDRQKVRWVFQIRFTSGSKKFLKSLWETLRRCKICKGGYLYKKTQSGSISGYELVFSHDDGVALFEFMYHNVEAEIYLKRKHDVFQRVLKTLHLGV